jgi:hypothetical protein
VLLLADGVEIEEKYGERIAFFISNKPMLKRVIKSWMDTKIEAVA